MVKGNSGEAARNRLIRRLLAVVLCCISIIAIFELSGYGGGYFGHNGVLAGHDGIGSIRKSNHEKKKIDYSSLSDKEKIHLIVSGRVQLIDLSVNKSIRESEENEYGDHVIGKFCEINWNLHKANPSKVPMFRDLISKSHCETPFQFNLKKAVYFIKLVDENSKYPNSHTMEPNGFVFHESRCGSTLAANALAAMNPSKHRVYSESSPPIVAIKACGLGGANCPKGTAASLFRDVVHVMGRTNNADEKHLFFKIQSVGTKYIDIAMDAFPSTPWIFIYRHPIHVMMSQLEQGPERANCVHQLQDVPHDAMTLLEDRGLTIHSLSAEERCALHLSTLCASAIKALERSNYGASINYEGIIDNLIEKTIPNHFKILMTNEKRENILAIGTHYSKGRGSRAKEFKNDNKRKEDAATPSVKRASKMFLNRAYDKLEVYAPTKFTL